MTSRPVCERCRDGPVAAKVEVDGRMLMLCKPCTLRITQRAKSVKEQRAPSNRTLASSSSPASSSPSASTELATSNSSRSSLGNQALPSTGSLSAEAKGASSAATALPPAPDDNRPVPAVPPKNKNTTSVAAAAAAGQRPVSSYGSYDPDVIARLQQQRASPGAQTLTNRMNSALGGTALATAAAGSSDGAGSGDSSFAELLFQQKLAEQRAQMTVRGEEPLEREEDIRFIINGATPINSGGKQYTAYVIFFIGKQQLPKNILRRYSQFAQLHKELGEFFPKSDLPKLTKKTLLTGSMDAKVVHRRMRKLQRYLNEVAKTPHVFLSDVFQNFLYTEAESLASSEADEEAGLVAASLPSKLYSEAVAIERDLKLKGSSSSSSHASSLSSTSSSASKGASVAPGTADAASAKLHEIMTLQEQVRREQAARTPTSVRRPASGFVDRGYAGGLAAAGDDKKSKKRLTLWRSGSGRSNSAREEEDQAQLQAGLPLSVSSSSVTAAPQTPEPLGRKHRSGSISNAFRKVSGRFGGGSSASGNVNPLHTVSNASHASPSKAARINAAKQSAQTSSIHSTAAGALSPRGPEFGHASGNALPDASTSPSSTASASFPNESSSAAFSPASFSSSPGSRSSTLNRRRIQDAAAAHREWSLLSQPMAIWARIDTAAAAAAAAAAETGSSGDVAPSPASLAEGQKAALSAGPSSEDDLRKWLIAGGANAAGSLRQSLEQLAGAQLRSLVRSQTAARCWLACRDLRWRRKAHERRTQVAIELFDTERAYVHSLEVLITKYVVPLRALAHDKKMGLLSESDVSVIFTNLNAETIFEESTAFLRELDERVGERGARWRGQATTLGDVFARRMRHFQKYYPAYYVNFDISNAVLKKRLKSNEKFRLLCDTIKADPDCQQLDLVSFLIMPIQRLPRYIMMLEQLLRYTPADQRDAPLLRGSLRQLRMLMDTINRHMNTRARMRRLQKDLSKCPNLLESPRRFMLLNSGSALRWCQDGLNGRKHVDLLVVVFNDQIVFGVKDKFRNAMPMHLCFLADPLDLPMSGGGGGGGGAKSQSGSGSMSGGLLGDAALSFYILSPIKEVSYLVRAPDERTKSEWLRIITSAVLDRLDPELLGTDALRSEREALQPAPDAPNASAPISSEAGAVLSRRVADSFNQRLIEVLQRRNQDNLKNETLLRHPERKTDAASDRALAISRRPVTVITPGSGGVAVTPAAARSRHSITPTVLAMALFDFVAQEEGDLGFSRGDVIEHVVSATGGSVAESDEASGWWFGRIGQRAGIFPRSLVKLMDDDDGDFDSSSSSRRE